jgi:hypothetical protein
MTKIQKSKLSRPGRFWSLSIEICVLFVICCLGFVILDTKLQGIHLSLIFVLRDRHGPNHHVVHIKIKRATKNLRPSFKKG